MIQLPPIHLKEFLKNKGLSSTAYKTLKAAKSVWINNKEITGDQLLFPGDIVTFNFPEQESSIFAQKGPLDIIFEDDYLIVVNKPAGILIHPTTKNAENSLANFVAGYYLEKNIKAGIHPVSRLDKNTSGLVVFAKKSYIQAALSKESMQKEYLGLVLGHPNEDIGDIIAPIERKPGSIIERQVSENAGKYAKTSFTVLEKYKTISLVQFILTTGRTHQIRVHAAFIGHPLLGDNLYGSKGPQSRHFLHASKITFKHPVTGEVMVISCKMPQDMEEAISKDKNNQEENNML